MKSAWRFMTYGFSIGSGVLGAYGDMFGAIWLALLAIISSLEEFHDR